MSWPSNPGSSKRVVTSAMWTSPVPAADRRPRVESVSAGRAPAWLSSGGCSYRGSGMDQRPRKLFSVDDHIVEPADTWSSRVAAKYRDRAPHIVREGKAEVWV